MESHSYLFNNLTRWGNDKTAIMQEKFKIMILVHIILLIIF